MDLALKSLYDLLTMTSIVRKQFENTIEKLQYLNLNLKTAAKCFDFDQLNVSWVSNLL